MTGVLGAQREQNEGDERLSCEEFQGITMRLGNSNQTLKQGQRNRVCTNGVPELFTIDSALRLNDSNVKIHAIS